MISLENVFLKPDVLISETDRTCWGLRSSTVPLDFPPIFPSAPSPRTRRCNSGSCSCLTSPGSAWGLLAAYLRRALAKLPVEGRRHAGLSQRETRLFLLLKVPDPPPAATPTAHSRTPSALLSLSPRRDTDLREESEATQATTGSMSHLQHNSPSKPLPLPSAPCAELGALPSERHQEDQAR